VAGRIKSNEKSNDLIGNRTCDLAACSIVPQQTALPHVLTGHEYKNENSGCEKYAEFFGYFY
jgi:hypothetical protein